MAWRANSQRPFVVNNGHIINFECVGNTCSYINYHCGTPVAMCLEIALLSLLVPCCYCSWVLALVIMQRCYSCCYCCCCCYWPLNFCSEIVTKANLNEWMNEWMREIFENKNSWWKCCFLFMICSLAFFFV